MIAAYCFGLLGRVAVAYFPVQVYQLEPILCEDVGHEPCPLREGWGQLFCAEVGEGLFPFYFRRGCGSGGLGTGLSGRALGPKREGVATAVFLGRGVDAGSDACRSEVGGRRA